MKLLVFGTALLLTGTSVFANSSDSRLPRAIKIEKSDRNTDGSTTITGPRLIRGNKSYPFGSKTSLEGICSIMGFDHYLSQTSIKTNDGNTRRAYVTSAGEFRIIIDKENHSIGEITCFNGKHKTQTKLDHFIENTDGTVTVINPKLVRGPRSYPFGSSNDSLSVCKAMGFDKYLTFSTVKKHDGNTRRAYVNSNGSYTAIIDKEHHSLSEVTCFNHGDNISVVEDSDGNQYFRNER